TPGAFQRSQVGCIARVGRFIDARNPRGLRFGQWRLSAVSRIDDAVHGAEILRRIFLNACGDQLVMRMHEFLPPLWDVNIVTTGAASAQIVLLRDSPLPGLLASLGGT